MSQDPRQRWPQDSMPSPFRQVYLDVKGEQSLEQLGLAIKMMLAEPAARYLFAGGAQVIRTRAAVGGFWPPSRRASCPTSPKTSPAPEWCKAASVSRRIASHWRKPTATKARPRRPPGARTHATRVRCCPGLCARTRDEIEWLVSPPVSHHSAWTCPTALPPASRAGRAAKLLLERAGERHAAA